MEIDSSATFESATMTCDGKELAVSTGPVARTWQWTDYGWATAALESSTTGASWAMSDSALRCDWQIPGLTGTAELLSVEAVESDDEGFTSRHLEVVSTIRYAASGFLLQHVIWAYPEAAGIRTQIRLRRMRPAQAGARPTAVPAGHGPLIEVKRGKPFTPSAYTESKPVAESFASTVTDRTQVELRVTGLKAGSSYSLGLSWWDWGGGGRWQSVMLASIDGEQKQVVVPRAALPGWLKGKKEQPGQQVVPIPAGIAPDGSVKVFINREAGAAACISELWLYEHGAQSQFVGVPANRLDEIKANAPANAGLVAYLDCGRLEDHGEERRQDAITERLPIERAGMDLHAIGYFSGTQGRNRRETEILRQEPLTALEGQCAWASILEGRKQNQGFLLVKESHKCVNTPRGGANTGIFSWHKQGIDASGLGWTPEAIGADRTYAAWANWLILYHGQDDDRDLAIKIWDRIRYPIDPDRDVYIMANTWGSTDNRRDAQIQAREDNILVEIDSQAGLGIDVQQIDDGWQGFGYNHWRPIKENALHEENAVYADYESDRYPVYPNGWQTVRNYARTKGVTMGLWAANNIPADDLIWNYDHGDFRYYKIDFAHLDTMPLVEELMGKARTLILHSGHKARINWDVTEAPPRVGYFFGREYGNIYLENRKPMRPAQVVYKPYLVLRDAWQVSRYLNLNKFQLTVQNVDRVNREVSDAYQHPHDYVVAQTLMGSPIFFQETHYYTHAARQQIRPLLAVYKQHRDDIFAGYIFPIGDKPDNATWSGFQCMIPEKDHGYLTLFRQIDNAQTTRAIRMKFLKPGSRLKLTDLMTDTTRVVTAGPDSELAFTIAEAPGFSFLRYELLP